MTNFYIDSNTGRIGEFWWLNSDPGTPIWTGNFSPWVKSWCVRWGTFGYGRNVKMFLKPIDL